MIFCQCFHVAHVLLCLFIITIMYSAKITNSTRLLSFRVIIYKKMIQPFLKRRQIKKKENYGVQMIRINNTIPIYNINHVCFKMINEIRIVCCLHKSSCQASVHACLYVSVYHCACMTILSTHCLFVFHCVLFHCFTQIHKDSQTLTKSTISFS